MSNKRQDLGFVDIDKLRSMELTGKFTINVAKGMMFLSSVADKEKFILVGARKDGQGVYLTTSIEQLKANPKVTKREPLKL